METKEELYKRIIKIVDLCNQYELDWKYCVYCGRQTILGGYQCICSTCEFKITELKYFTPASLWIYMLLSQMTFIKGNIHGFIKKDRG